MNVGKYKGKGYLNSSLHSLESKISLFVNNKSKIDYTEEELWTLKPTVENVGFSSLDLV